MAESFAHRLAAAANKILHPVGLHLLRRERAFDMDGLLERAARRGFHVNTWIDVGASDGSWSRLARRHFPHAAYLLFEPLAERQQALAALHRKFGLHIVAAAAGAASGTVSFAIDPALDGSGVAATPGPGTDTRDVPMETLAAAVGTRGLQGPYGIKLDTHGFELPILEGAQPLLPSTELLVIEAYNFTLRDGAVRFHELCAWLEPHGFRCCDIADLMRRPTDGALWQMDIAFARATHPIFASNSYAAGGKR